MKNDNEGYIIICKDSKDTDKILGYFGGYVMDSLNIVDSIHKAEIFTDPFQLHIVYEKLMKYHTMNLYISDGTITWSTASINISVKELV